MPATNQKIAAGDAVMDEEAAFESLVRSHEARVCRGWWLPGQAVYADFLDEILT